MPPSPLALVVLLVCSLPLIPVSVSATTLYAWRNADGSFMFTDNPNGAPPDVQVHAWTEEDVPPSHPGQESAPSAIAEAPPVEGVPDAVTQGEFAVRLVEELGLEDRPAADQAIQILVKARIAPRLGRWELEEPMTSELTMRLRRLTIAAATEGWITLTPEEGLLAFDTTAALLGVTIPWIGESDPGSRESNLSIEDTPPLVYVAPPPLEVSPYYVWQPVTDGYWWDGVIVSGFFVLDLDRYSAQYRHRPKQGRHRNGHGPMTPVRLGHRFGSHLTQTHPEFADSSRPRETPPAPEAYRSRGPRKRPSVALTSPASSLHRIVRGPGPSEGRERGSQVGRLRVNHPGGRSVDTRALRSEPGVDSTDGSSNPNQLRNGTGRVQSGSRGFATR